MIEKQCRHILSEGYWSIDELEDFEYIKKAILKILKEKKVSLSKTYTLFNEILYEIEDKNPVVL